MDEQQKKLRELNAKTSQLEQLQENLMREIIRLKKELYDLTQQLEKETLQKSNVKDENIIKQVEAITKPVRKPAAASLSSTPGPAKADTPWEEFIGSNLLNKIGIAILVIGIGFGVKYAIDHQLLNPLTRVILGYIAGAALLVIAMRLKKNYENFSAVLLSGGMAALYFITYAAYDFYGFFPQIAAFIIMVLFTVFTVVAALQYNMEIIGIIGLVGAYAVPFLLNDGSGRVLILYSYMALINAGILVLSFKKYWKKLYYLAFIFTWLIFGTWFLRSYDAAQHFWLCLAFSTLFFVIFYTALLSYKLIRKESFGFLDVAVLLTNSFIQFGIGYMAVSATKNGDEYLGLFTLAIASLHFVVCVIIYTRHDAYKDIFYFVAGMVLTFLTIAVPVQLDGNWVTLIWAAEALLLFWIGRTKSFPAYEKISYPLVVLSMISLLQDWEKYYAFNSYRVEEFNAFTPFLNIHFVTGLWVAGVLFMIGKLNFDKRFAPAAIHTDLMTLVNIGVPALFLVVLYITFYNDIGHYWNTRFVNSGITSSREDEDFLQYDHILLRFKTIWLINYSAFFGAALSLVIQNYLKQKNAALLALLYNAVVLSAFLAIGIFTLTILRHSYTNQTADEQYVRDYFYLLIRYVSLVFILPLFWSNFRLAQAEFFGNTIKRAERIFFHFCLLLILSSELVHWLDLARVPNTFKLGLTILWGVYGLMLVVLGLKSSQKYLRVSGIVLFAVTLIKLFFYDMEHMSTISKTLVLVVLGTVLLIASFLYNRNKKINP